MNKIKQNVGEYC